VIGLFGIAGREEGKEKRAQDPPSSLRGAALAQGERDEAIP